MPVEVNWQAWHRLRFPSRATLRRPACHPQVERKVALRMQARVALVGPIESPSNHVGLNPLSEWGVSGENATYVTITCVPELLVGNRELKIGRSIHWSTDAAPHLFDDPHVRLQSSRSIFASPCDTALRRHGGIEWPEHDILLLEFL